MKQHDNWTSLVVSLASVHAYTFLVPLVTSQLHVDICLFHFVSIFIISVWSCVHGKGAIQKPCCGLEMTSMNTSRPKHMEIYGIVATWIGNRSGVSTTTIHSWDTYATWLVDQHFCSKKVEDIRLETAVGWSALLLVLLGKHIAINHIVIVSSFYQWIGLRGMPHI